MDEEMEGLREQLCDTIEILYEDQYALIIIGETEQDGENTNFRIGGTAVVPADEEDRHRTETLPQLRARTPH